MSSLTEKKFMLPTAAVLIGAVMVWTDKLGGSEWALMTSTLISGFYAIKGWDYKTRGGRGDGNEKSNGNRRS